MKRRQIISVLSFLLCFLASSARADGSCELAPNLDTGFAGCAVDCSGEADSRAYCALFVDANGFQFENCGCSAVGGKLDSALADSGIATPHFGLVTGLFPYTTFDIIQFILLNQPNAPFNPIVLDIAKDISNATQDLKQGK